MGRLPRLPARGPQWSRKALPRPRILWIAAALVAVLAVVLLWALPRLQQPTGTLVVVAAGRSATVLADSTLMLQRNDGSWLTVGSVSGSIPPAPDQHQLLALAFPVGGYDHIRLRGDVERVSVTVKAGQVEPLLLGIEAGNLIPGAVYAGNDEVNLGLGELAGKFVAMPGFDLVDQSSRAFDSSSTAGKDVVIAAFHTTCHETCPLYTALFFQLAKKIPASVTLAEVTTDPDVDTPAVLLDYRNRTGATWEFATGTRDQLASFWKPFGVELASGDTHTSTLALLDRHGYIRLFYRGSAFTSGRSSIPTWPSAARMVSRRCRPRSSSVRTAPSTVARSASSTSACSPRSCRTWSVSRLADGCCRSRFFAASRF